MRIATTALLILAVPTAADDAKKALADLQGKWEFTEVTEGGRKVDAEKLKAFSITFTGDQAEMPFDGRKAISQTVTLRPAANPREIDLQYPPEIEGGQTRPGIYKLEGGVLTLAIGVGKDAKRPASFESTGRPNPSVVMVLKKAK